MPVMLEFTPQLPPHTSSLEDGEAVRVVSDVDILGGMPVVLGTRVPAATLVAYLRTGYSVADIAEDYPTLPAAWAAAVQDWAAGEYGPDWRTAASRI
jgi:uncharacterized protein (DUF433 family)